MSANCRPLSYRTVLCNFHSLTFFTECILLEMFMVCLVSLPLFAIHTSDLISNIIRSDCFGTTFGSFFINLLFNLMKCDRAIPAMHDALHSLAALVWETLPGTCLLWSIGPPWWNKIYASVLLPVSGHSFHIESENTVNWFSVLLLSCINSSDRGAYSILA